MKRSLIPIWIIFSLSFRVYCQIPTTGLVAYWPFNGNANDESITKNHATVLGAELTTDRFNKPGQAYFFNGSSDRLQASENNAYDFGSGDFCITSWVSLNEIKTARIVSAGYTINDEIWGLGFGSHPVWGNGLRINYFVFSGGTYHDFSSEDITGYRLGQWVMVGITKTGSTLTFYFNGKKTGTATISFVSNAGSYLSIGSRQETSGSQIEFLNGRIDEVRIYNRSLNESEISALYNSTRNPMVAWYPLNGNANDESGNGNNGTIVGTLIPTTDRNGSAGKAYAFSLINYISVPTSSAFFTDEFTVSYWYKVESHWGLRSVLSCVGNKGGYTQVFDGTGFSYMLGYNFPNSANVYFWASYTVPNIGNTWQHITVTYQKTGDNSSASKLYINGELKSSDSHANSIAYPGSEIFYLGRNHSDLGFNGELDDIRFFSRVLNETEIDSLFKADLTTDLENNFLSDIKIFPNPTNREINIEMGSIYKKINIKIFDISGKLIREQEYTDVPRFQVNLDEPSGMYFLTVNYENKKAAFKIIKK